MGKIDQLPSVSSPTGDQTGNLLVHRTTLNQLSHSGFSSLEKKMPGCCYSACGGKGRGGKPTLPHTNLHLTALPCFQPHPCSVPTGLAVAAASLGARVGGQAPSLCVWCKVHPPTRSHLLYSLKKMTDFLTDWCPSPCSIPSPSCSDSLIHTHPNGSQKAQT